MGQCRGVGVQRAEWARRARGEEAVSWLARDRRANTRVGIQHAEGQTQQSGMPTLPSPVPPCPPSAHPLREDHPEDRAPRTAPALALQGKAAKWGWNEKGG